MPREALRSSVEQHKAKNLKSKSDDLNLDLAMKKTKKYLEERFSRGGGVAKASIILKSLKSLICPL